MLQFGLLFLSILAGRTKIANQHVREIKTLIEKKILFDVFLTHNMKLSKYPSYLLIDFCYIFSNPHHWACFFFFKSAPPLVLLSTAKTLDQLFQSPNIKFFYMLSSTFRHKTINNISWEHFLISLSNLLYAYPQSSTPPPMSQRDNKLSAKSPVSEWIKSDSRHCMKCIHAELIFQQFSFLLDRS